MDQHDDDAGSRFAKLEARLEVVLARLEEMTQEVLAIKQQQADLLTIVRTNLKKK